MIPITFLRKKREKEQIRTSVIKYQVYRNNE